MKILFSKQDKARSDYNTTSNALLETVSILN